MNIATIIIVSTFHSIILKTDYQHCNWVGSFGSLCPVSLMNQTHFSNIFGWEKMGLVHETRSKWVLPAHAYMPDLDQNYIVISASKTSMKRSILPNRAVTNILRT